MRTLGIVGLDYCGSTLVSNVLSSMPGVLNVGESHWIIDRNLGCRECHKKPCPIFTTAMLNDLRSCDLSKENWWDVISRHTDADLVISTDKLPKHYDLFGVPDNLLFFIRNPNQTLLVGVKGSSLNRRNHLRNYSMKLKLMPALGGGWKFRVIS